MAQTAPPDSSVAMVGTTLISVHYGAPSADGRQVFGTLVPYNQPWRPGGGDATTFRTLRALKMGDVDVARGTYTLFTIPAAASGACNGGGAAGPGVLILSRQTSGAFDPAQEAARVPMRACQLADAVERLTIRVIPGSGSTGTLRIEWERTRYDIPFSLVR
ncbi:MAG TPA: DUF2911 domain-containing protein [Gemmatimonadaceae bacterium]|nr:DUF2911 domain-containing protein [Gemmatimonadaceae bacterium]